MRRGDRVGRYGIVEWSRVKGGEGMVGYIGGEGRVWKVR